MRNSKLQKLFSKASTERQQAVLVFMAHRLARYGEPLGQGRVRIKRGGLDIISQAVTAPDAATARFLEISTAITHHNKPVFSGTVRYRLISAARSNWKVRSSARCSSAVGHGPRLC